MPKPGYQSPEYVAWAHMRARCLRPHNSAYADYGGRGITICERWLHSFENFLADMGRRPSANHSLDRYPDNDGNYSPENCRWATPKEQGQNKRNNINVTLGDETHCVSEWVRIKSLNIGSVLSRLCRGMAPEDALTRPFRRRTIP